MWRVDHAEAATDALPVLERLVDLYKLINCHVSSANSQYKIVAVYRHEDLLLEEAVNAFRFSNKQALCPFYVITLIDKLSKLFVDRVILSSNIEEFLRIQ